MRFLNQPITRTLVYLTIVAIAGVALLPIAGNCQLANLGWTYSTDRTNGNFRTSYAIIEEGTQKPKGGWQLSASVNAKGVTASVDPGEFNTSLFDTSHKFTGTGRVTAARHEYIWYHGRFAWHCNNHEDRQSASGSDYIVCGGHTEPGDIDTNHRSSSFWNGEGTALTLDIQVSTKETHTCFVRLIKNKKTFRVNLSVGAPIIPEGETIDVEYGSATEKAVSLSESVKTTVTVPVVAQDVGVYVSVSFDDEASSSAHANFSFESISDSGSVWYDSP